MTPIWQRMKQGNCAILKHPPPNAESYIYNHGRLSGKLFVVRSHSGAMYISRLK